MISNRIYYSIVRLVFLLLTCSGAHIAAAEEAGMYSIYRWPVVPGAAYYRARYQSRAGEVAFRTYSTSLTLPTKGNITVKAIAKTGQLVKVMTIKSSGMIQGIESSTYGGDPTMADLAKGRDWDPMADEIDEPNAAVGGRRKHPGQLRLRLLFGVGREAIATQGGIDRYSGNAAIGGTSGWIIWHPSNAAWMLIAHGEGHNLAVSEAEGQPASKFLRATGRAFLYYELTGSNPQQQRSLGVGVGSIYTQMPTMRIKDVGSGSALLGLESAIGPAFGLEATSKLGAAWSADLSLSYQPTSFSGKRRVLTTMADSVFSRHLGPNWTLDLGFSWYWVRFQAEQSCVIAECRNFRQATSTVFNAALGSGVKF